MHASKRNDPPTAGSTGGKQLEMKCVLVSVMSQVKQMVTIVMGLTSISIFVFLGNVAEAIHAGSRELAAAITQEEARRGSLIQGAKGDLDLFPDLFQLI